MAFKRFFVKKMLNPMFYFRKNVKNFHYSLTTRLYLW